MSDGADPKHAPFFSNPDRPPTGEEKATWPRPVREYVEGLERKIKELSKEEE